MLPAGEAEGAGSQDSAYDEPGLVEEEELSDNLTRETNPPNEPTNPKPDDTLTPNDAEKDAIVQGGDGIADINTEGDVSLPSNTVPDGSIGFDGYVRHCRLERGGYCCLDTKTAICVNRAGLRSTGWPILSMTTERLSGAAGQMPLKVGKLVSLDEEDGHALEGRFSTVDKGSFFGLGDGFLVHG